MKIETTVNRLWIELAKVIDQSKHSELYDYSQSKDHQELDRLLAEETANEKGHRRFTNGRYPVSNVIGAKITLLSNVYRGCMENITMPPASLFLTIRRSAAEAITIGHILRNDLTAEWISAARELDYSKIMNG